jgi:hypothetical protein
MPSNAAFHPTIETVGFQTAFSVKWTSLSERESRGNKENPLLAKKQPRKW